ncbi:hypothetical protein PSTT_11388 [Puccinia striiformis]|uniref:Uncharacterized protein n=1 Tax=Puccinia striiformis TaxID=27350 RepID=A0A2S4V0K6_9BASI|nr:hypothetical protein PSTT_11388 [Puccinia striiformis]
MRNPIILTYLATLSTLLFTSNIAMEDFSTRGLERSVPSMKYCSPDQLMMIENHQTYNGLNKQDIPRLTVHNHGMDTQSLQLRGHKRKEPDLETRPSETRDENSALPQPQRRKAIKLFGVFLLPAEQEEPDSMKIDRNSPEIHPESPDQSRNPSSSHTAQTTEHTARNSAKAIEKHPEEYKDNPDQIKSPGQIFQFDKTAFDQSLTSNKVIKDDITNICNQMSLRGGDRERIPKLILTEEKFITFQRTYHLGEVHRNPPQDMRIWYKTKQEENKNKLINDDEARKSLRESACITLVNQREVWYRYWEDLSHSTLNIQAFIEQLNCQRPEKIRNLILTFIFYVQMISTIIPDLTQPGHQTEEDHGLRIREAFKIVVQLFGSNHHTLSPEEGVMFGLDELKNKRHLIQRQVAKSGPHLMFPSVWILVSIWLKFYRNSFYLELSKFSPKLQNTKRFFNSIFCYTVLVLTRRLSSHLKNNHNQLIG